MIQQIELSEAKLHLAEIIKDALDGKEIIITENNFPLVMLVRISSTRGDRPLGTAHGQIWMSDDFNDSFEEYSDELPSTLTSIQNE